MGELRDLVLRDYRLNSRATALRIEPAFRHLMQHLPERFPLEESHEQSVRYILARADEGAKPATILYEIAALGRAFSLATRSRLIPAKPILARPAVNNVRRGFLPSESMRLLLRSLREPVRSISQFAYITGWRKSEVLSLTWSQVDWDSGTVRLEPGSTKNREGRTYPFWPHRELTALLTRCRERASGPHVFQRRGERVRDFRGEWNKACGALGLRNTFHDLKRSSVRNLERAGVPRSVAMILIGHKTESIYRRYAIVNEDDLSRGVRLVARLSRRRNA